MTINPFTHGFRNDVHHCRAAVADGNYVIASLHRRMALRSGGFSSVVSLTLYGPDWSEKDVERAERQERIVTGTDSQMTAVRDALLYSCSTWLSLSLRSAEDVSEEEA